jgi:hypothetical protein
MKSAAVASGVIHVKVYGGFLKIPLHLDRVGDLSISKATSMSSHHLQHGIWLNTHELLP